SSVSGRPAAGNTTRRGERGRGGVAGGGPAAHRAGADHSRRPAAAAGRAPLSGAGPPHAPAPRRSAGRSAGATAGDTYALAVRPRAAAPLPRGAGAARRGSEDPLGPAGGRRHSDARQPGRRSLAGARRAALRLAGDAGEYRERRRRQAAGGIGTPDRAVLRFRGARREAPGAPVAAGGAGSHRHPLGQAVALGTLGAAERAGVGRRLPAPPVAEDPGGALNELKREKKNGSPGGT